MSFSLRLPALKIDILLAYTDNNIDRSVFLVLLLFPTWRPIRIAIIRAKLMNLIMDR